MLAIVPMLPSSPVCNCAFLLTVRGPFSPEAYARAVAGVAARHDVLRPNVDRSLRGELR